MKCRQPIAAELSRYAAPSFSQPSSSLMRLVVLLILLWLVVIVPDARACGCGDNRPWLEVAQSDALFIGQLVEAELAYVIPEVPWLNIPERLLPALRPNRVKLVFEVERYWTGSGKRRIVIFTDRSSCALEVPDLGSTMLIEANAYRGTLFTFLCLRSVPIYSGGEVHYMAARPEFSDYRLLTRDSLQIYLGAGREPSGGEWKWIFAVLLISAGLVFWWQRTRAA